MSPSSSGPSSSISAGCRGGRGAIKVGRSWGQKAQAHRWGLPPAATGIELSRSRSSATELEPRLLGLGTEPRRQLGPPAGPASPAQLGPCQCFFSGVRDRHRASRPKQSASQGRIEAEGQIAASGFMGNAGPTPNQASRNPSALKAPRGEARSWTSSWPPFLTMLRIRQLHEAGRWRGWWGRRAPEGLDLLRLFGQCRPGFRGLVSERLDPWGAAAVSHGQFSADRRLSGHIGGDSSTPWAQQRLDETAVEIASIHPLHIGVSTAVRKSLTI